jgi:predicted transcriptional regulator YdeE
MIFKDILKEAINLIGGQRNTDYGDRVTNHENIANLWSAFLGKKISAHDVAICMALVKVARLMHSRKSDSYVDLAAYGAIAGEIAEREEGKDAE